MTEKLMADLKKSSSWQTSDIIKSFVEAHNDKAVLTAIAELSDMGDIFSVQVASMIKQSAGLQVGPDHALVRKVKLYEASPL